MAKNKPAGPLPKEIAPAYQAWTKGDWAQARKEAKAVLAQNPQGEVRELAERLLRDTSPDPRALMAGAGSAAFVGVILLLLFAH